MVFLCNNIRRFQPTKRIQSNLFDKLTQSAQIVFPHLTGDSFTFATDSLVGQLIKLMRKMVMVVSSAPSLGGMIVF